MNKGWLELESDPGLFTLLVQDFGVKGVQVEEIYDLQKPIEGPAYGFIFLFRWIEERRSRRKTITEEESFLTDENVVNNIFFAQQVIPNSCASHALLSVLLNCEKVSLGETLSKLKMYCKNMSPENKGYAIGNIPELAKAHNSHARQETSHLPEKQQGMTVRTMEAFHFVSYVPIHGHLFELDGLKPHPIDHGPWSSTEDWTEKFRHVISERLGMATGGEPYHDIRYNLMAVVPDKVSLYEQKLSTLKTNRQIVLDALQQMVKVTNTNISLAEKEKCLAAVKKHVDVTSCPVAMETCDTMATIKEETKSTINTPYLSNTESKTTINVKKEKLDPDIGLNVSKSADHVDNKSIAIPSHGQGDMRTIHETTIKLEDSIDSKTQCKTNMSTNTCADVMCSENYISKDSLSVPGVVVTNPVTTAISTTVQNTVATTTDLTKPLTIETKFSTSPGPGSETTDTASEVGSCFSSPSSSTFGGGSTQNSPNVSLDCSPGSKGDGDGKSKTKFSSQQGFRPKDLIALLKNVENEIKICETKLQDEQEKINKYKIDDCRRTHNYDHFLCTFLSMLAEQGHLADLVQQHSFIKKRVPGHIGKLAKLTQAAKRKRTKAKRRR